MQISKIFIFTNVLFLLFLTSSSNSFAQNQQDILNEAKKKNVYSQSQVKEELSKRGISENQARQMARMRGIDYDTFLQTYFGEDLSTVSTQTPQVNILKDTTLPTVLIEEEQSDPLVILSRPESDKKFFGYDIFDNNPFFQKEYLVGNIDEGYIIAPGDVLRIVIFGNNSLELESTVDLNGNINIPAFGVFMAAGNTFGTLKERLKVYFGKSFYGLLNKPQTTFIDVSLGQIRPTKITVIGESQTPGPHLINGMATVLNALYASGGIKTSGSLRTIRVYRNNQLLKEIDLYDFITSGKLDDDIRLTNNDLIYIPPRLSSVSLSGHVKRAATFELKLGESIMDLVKFSGGLLPDVSLTNVNIQRITPFKDRKFEIIYDRYLTAINYQQLLDDKSNFILADGDEVNFKPILSKNMGEVTISGNVNQPGTYPVNIYKDLKSLIVSGAKNIAPNTFLGKIDLSREDLDGNKSFQTYNLNDILSDNVSVMLKSQDVVRIYNLEEVRGAQMVKVSGFIEEPKTLFWRENLNLFDVIFQSTSLEELSYKALLLESRIDVKRFDPIEGLFRILNFSLDDIDGLQKTKVAPMDEIILYSKAVSEDTSPNVRIGGFVRSPQTVRLTSKMYVEDAILSAGGFAEYADQGIVIVNREAFDPYSGKISERFEVQVDLNYLTGKSKEPIAKFLLQNNDVIAVRKLPLAKNSIAVTVEGAVFYPGIVMSENIKESVKDLIQHAGGLLPNAYLKSSYIQRGNDIIAIKLNKSKNFNQSILIDGDRIVVNEKSGTVETMGAVENEAVFVWKKGKRAKYYLRNSGGKLAKVAGKAYVISGNGYSKKVNTFNNPVVLPNSKLMVNQNPPKEKKDKEFIDSFIKVLSVTTGALTTLLLIQRLD